MNNQNQNAGFTEVGGISRGLPFDPRATEKNNMYYVEGDPRNVLDGYLVLMKQIPSKKKPGDITTIWKIQTVNQNSSLGDIYDVIGDTVLNDRLGQIPLKTFIRVAYTGRKHKQGYNGQFSQTNSYHSWFVGQNHNVMPYDQVKAQFGESFSPAYVAAMAGNIGQQNQNQGQPQFSQPGAQQYGNNGQQQFGQGQFQQQGQQGAFGQGQYNPNQGQQQPGQQQGFPANGQQNQGQQFGQPSIPATGGQQFGQPAFNPNQQGTATAPFQPQQGQNFQQPPAQGTVQGQQFNPAPPPAQQQQGQNFQHGHSQVGQGQQQGQQGTNQPFTQDLPF